MPEKNLDLLKLIEDDGLTSKCLWELAYATEFCKRASRKIMAPDFFVQQCALAMEGTVSCNDMAVRIELKTGARATRQAYWLRTDESCVRFFQAILERIMHSRCDPSAVEELQERGIWKRILVQDSTVIQLPLGLFPFFSGVKNATTSVCNARIQGVYDLLSKKFIGFSVDPYSRNDLLATMDIAVEPGDLILRDRGYFTVASAAEHQKTGADSIYRYKHKTTLSEPASGATIDLLECLTRDGTADMQVSVGPEKTLTLRLVAVPVPEEVANLRRMKAKKQMKGHAPSQNLLALMSWNIFLTTLNGEAFPFKKILQLYGLRWRIENIFKTWKSHLSFAKLHNVSVKQLRVLLTARLIMIVILHQRLYLPLACAVTTKTGKQLSLMKFMRHLSKNLIDIISMVTASSPCTAKLMAFLERHCTYDKRKRANYIDHMEEALAGMEAIIP